MPNPYIINPSQYTTIGGGIAATGEKSSFQPSLKGEKPVAHFTLRMIK
jgi:hypothetical protein